MFSIVSMWDAFTTVIGTSHFLKLEDDIFASIAAAVVILAFMTCTKYIWEEKGMLRFVLMILWVTAFGYDIFTSYHGNLIYILEGTASGQQTLFLWGLTILTSTSPVLISIVLSD